MTSITHSAGTISPTVVDGYEATRTPGSIVHQIIGRADPDITMRPASLRTGSLRCVFASRATAATAYTVLGTLQVFTLVDADVPNVNMSFVVANGQLALRLDDQTRAVWIVDVPYVEVLP